MDNKTIPNGDEKSAYHLSALPSKSQAQGVPKEEIVAKELASKHDDASAKAAKRRRM